MVNGVTSSVSLLFVGRMSKEGFHFYPSLTRNSSLANLSHLTRSHLLFSTFHGPPAHYRPSPDVCRGCPNILQTVWRWDLVICCHLCGPTMTQLKQQTTKREWFGSLRIKSPQRYVKSKPLTQNISTLECCMFSRGDPARLNSGDCISQGLLAVSSRIIY